MSIILRALLRRSDDSLIRSPSVRLRYAERIARLKFSLIYFFFFFLLRVRTRKVDLRQSLEPITIRISNEVELLRRVRRH